MKTKKLIELLMKEDPSGEEECCIDSNDIYAVSREIAYWDGILQKLIRDEANPYYNVIGAKYISKGYKIRLRSLTIEEAIDNDPDINIDYSELSTERQKELKRYDDAIRDETRKMIAQLEQEKQK